MKISEMMQDLADQPYSKDFRLQRHILEDEDCLSAKKKLIKHLGPHEAGHMLSVIDSVLMHVFTHGLPDDLTDVLNSYKMNGAKNRKSAEKIAPEMTASDFAKLWGDDDDKEAI